MPCNDAAPDDLVLAGVADREQLPTSPGQVAYNYLYIYLYITRARREKANYDCAGELLHI